MSFAVEVFPPDQYAAEAAARIGQSLPDEGTVVITGGSTAAAIYPALAEIARDWSRLNVYFSDERCVSPEDERSNFDMARRLLLEAVRPGGVYRMHGEGLPKDLAGHGDSTGLAAKAYGTTIRGAVDAGIDLILLGMGADAHVAAMFPGSPSLREDRLCVAVDRPDGLKGLTLTPPALLAGKDVLLIVAGEGKAEAVRRAVRGDEPAEACPARVLADHPNVTFLLDEPAASLL
jgi:6-phosphogluconolactonase